jgi:hypothetical protein
MILPILVVGDVNCDDFGKPRVALAKHCANFVANTSAAMDLLCGGFAPALIVIAQRWPGEFSSHELTKLKRAAPLAKFIALLGPWLEGETRTGKPWPGMQRIYWHQAESRFNCELELLLDGAPETWAAPDTFHVDERALAAAIAESPSSDPGAAIYDPTAPLIVIRSSPRDTANSLAELCAEQRWNTLWLRELPSATPLHASAVLFDVRSNVSAELSNLAALRAATDDALIIALVGFPRLGDVQRLQSTGVTAVISKPFLTSDVVWHVEQALVLASADL